MFTGGLLLIWHTRKTWLVAATLGLATAVVDYFVHPGQFGPIFMEAAVTGLGATVLSYIVATLLKRVRLKRDQTKPAEVSR